MKNWKIFSIFFALACILLLGYFWIFGTEQTSIDKTTKGLNTHNSVSEHLTNTRATTKRETKKGNKPLFELSLTTDDCQNLVREGKNLSNIERKKNSEIIGFFRQLETMDIPYQDTLVIGELAGFSKDDVVSASSGHFGSFKSDKIYGLYSRKNDTPRLSARQSALIESSSEQGGINKIIDALRNRDIPVNAHFWNSSQLGYIIQNSKNLSQHNLEELLNVGLKADHYSLVYALKRGYSDEMLNILLSNVDEDISKEWSERSTQMNLALLAAKHGRPSFLEAFHLRGVSIKTEDASILDVLSAPVDGDQLAKLIDIIEFAKDNSVAPLFATTKNKLLSWLPKEEHYLIDFIKDSDIHPKHVTDNAKTLRKIIEKYNEAIDIARESELYCEDNHQISVIEPEILIGGDERFVTDTSKLTLNEKQVRQAQIDAEKKTFFEELLKQEQEALSEITHEELTEKDKLFEEMVSLTNQGKWHDALEVAKTIENTYQDKTAPTYLLGLSLPGEQSLTYITQLLKLGAQLTEPTIMALAFFGRADLVDIFLQYGMDVYFSDGYGDNALTIQAKMLNSFELFKRLVELGVPVKPEGSVIDPLDISLGHLETINLDLVNQENFAERMRVFNYIKILLDFGAPVERSHLDKIESLKISNPEIYSIVEQTFLDLVI